MFIVLFVVFYNICVIIAISNDNAH